MPKKLPKGWKEGTVEEFLNPFFQPTPTCECGYCTNEEIRGFIDTNLKDLIDNGRPRPQKSRICKVVSEKYRVSPNTVRGWFKCMELWDQFSA
jgi:hypothetical protein